MKRCLAVLLALSCLATGCKPVVAPVTSVAPTPPQEPVVLTLEPASGPPGTEVTVRVRLQEPWKAWAGGDGKSWNFQLCWGPCGPHQWGQAIWPTPSRDDRRLFIGKVQVPAYLNGRRLRAGALDVLLACATDYGQGCEDRPQARAAFRLTGELPAVDWAALPVGDVHPLPALDRMPSPVVDPGNPDHQAECQGGTANPNDPKDPPQLRVTHDRGKHWETISLKGVPLGAFAGLAGCRAFSLDPHASGSYYVAGIFHPGANSEPAPLYTVDGGRTWRQVDAPTGFAAAAFLGYSVTPSDVTAWFGRQEQGDQPPSVGGTATSDGGTSWRTVSLGCPTAGPCLWEIPSPVYQKLSRSLIRSDDGGKTWAWATWQGQPLQTRSQLFSTGGTNLEMVGALAGETSPYATIPLLRSTDAGRSWQWVDVPAPPGGRGLTPAVWIEADGALHFRTDQNVDYRLGRGASIWERQ